jgi:hypothetical protein
LRQGIPGLTRLDHQDGRGGQARGGVVTLIPPVQATITAAGEQAKGQITPPSRAAGDGGNAILVVTEGSGRPCLRRGRFANFGLIGAE